MFGIGLPELILILAVALIVVGPDKLPELAKSLGRGIVELKKAAASLKDSLNEEDEKTSGWEQGDMAKHPNKLLDAYKNLPEHAMEDRPDTASPEKTDADAAASVASGETGQVPPAEPGTESKESKTGA